MSCDESSEARFAAYVEALTGVMGHADTVLHGSGSRAHRPLPRPGSGDADGLRASQLQHAVERVDADVDLGGAAPVGAAPHGSLEGRSGSESGWATARRAVVEAAFWPRAGGEAPKRAPRAFAQAGQFSRPVLREDYRAFSQVAHLAA